MNALCQFFSTRNRTKNAWNIWKWSPPITRHTKSKNSKGMGLLFWSFLNTFPFILSTHSSETWQVDNFNILTLIISIYFKNVKFKNFAFIDCHFMNKMYRSRACMRDSTLVTSYYTQMYYTQTKLCKCWSTSEHYCITAYRNHAGFYTSYQLLHSDVLHTN